MLNLRNCWHKKDRENSLYRRLWVRVDGSIAILAGVVNFLPYPNPPRTRSEGVRNQQMIEDCYMLLVTYKYLKTDGRVRQNRGFSQPDFVAATRVKKNGFFASRYVQVCISAKTL